jgi:hypothetical protein
MPGVFDEALGLGTTILLYPNFEGEIEDFYDGL